MVKKNKKLRSCCLALVMLPVFILFLFFFNKYFKSTLDTGQRLET